MGFIGQPLNAGNLSVDVFTGNGSTTVFALTYSVGSSESLAIYLDGVKQAVSTYTASGTVLTFTTAPPNLVGIEVVFLALSISLPTPGDGTVTAVKIATDAVTTAKIAANAVDETKLKDALVADFTEVVVSASDSILLGDATDSGNTKRDTVQGILDLVPASGVTAKLISVTYNMAAASGTQDITGFGFDPAAIHVMSIYDVNDTWSHGYSDFLLDRCSYAEGNNFRADGKISYLDHGGANQTTGVASSISDGFRITWTKAGTVSGTASLYCMGYK